MKENKLTGRTAIRWKQFNHKTYSVFCSLKKERGWSKAITGTNSERLWGDDGGAYGRSVVLATDKYSSRDPDSTSARISAQRCVEGFRHSTAYRLIWITPTSHEAIYFCFGQRLGHSMVCCRAAQSLIVFFSDRLEDFRTPNLSSRALVRAWNCR